MHFKIKKRILIIGLLFLAITALVTGIVLPAYAANGPAGKNIQNPAFHLLQGKILSISSPDFTVQTAKQGQVTISTGNNTQYYTIPAGKIRNLVTSHLRSDNGNGNKKLTPANLRSYLGNLNALVTRASFSDIAVGDRVIVRADSNNLAKQVLIIKAPVNRTIKGTITLVDPAHIMITPADGSPITLNVTSTTRIVLKGQTSISGYAVALYNSTNDNALLVRVQATAPTSP